MTTDEDVEKLLEQVNKDNRRYIDYERQQLRIVSDRLKSTLDKVLEVQNDFTVEEKALFDARIRSVVENIPTRFKRHSCEHKQYIFERAVCTTEGILFNSATNYFPLLNQGLLI